MKRSSSSMIVLSWSVVVGIYAASSSLQGAPNGPPTLGNRPSFHRETVGRGNVIANGAIQEWLAPPGEGFEDKNPVSLGGSRLRKSLDAVGGGVAGSARDCNDNKVSDAEDIARGDSQD